ncbi:MAG TPA: hypothetical protein VFO72_01260 [Pyrinomonadaceae bacterium]|nr:hypothetical protein [Pyrinomonadaceae bacterium]
MNDRENFSTCERADELVSVLYGEATKRERGDFEAHLNQCATCRAEFAAFAQVRQSIGEWRDEALIGFVFSRATAAPAKKSATGALRQFFDLSPLWMKGAVGFAAVLFCVLAALALMRLQRVEKISPVATVNPDAIYTKQDLERAVLEALAKEQREPAPFITMVRPTPKRSNVAKVEPRSRRPFSKAEREQLAAELRLLSDDDVALDLLGDRINQ